MKFANPLTANLQKDSTQEVKPYVKLGSLLIKADWDFEKFDIVGQWYDADEREMYFFNEDYTGKLIDGKTDVHIFDWDLNYPYLSIEKYPYNENYQVRGGGGVSYGYFGIFDHYIEWNQKSGMFEIELSEDGNTMRGKWWSEKSSKWIYWTLTRVNSASEQVIAKIEGEENVPV